MLFQQEVEVVASKEYRRIQKQLRHHPETNTDQITKGSGRCCFLYESVIVSAQDFLCKAFTGSFILHIQQIGNRSSNIRKALAGSQRTGFYLLAQ